MRVRIWVYTNIVNDNESIEHKFVKYADKICAYIKCIDEVKMSNSEFFKAEKTIRAEIDAIDSPEVKFFMENFVDAFYLTLDELEG